MRSIKLPIVFLTAVASLPIVAAAQYIPDFRRDYRPDKREYKQDNRRNGWPSRDEIRRAQDRTHWDRDRAVRERYHGRDVSFVPNDIRDINDRDRERGFILGRLRTTVTSADRLPPGTYQVYVRHRNGQWEAYFCDHDQPVARSTEVKWRDDRQNRPSFEIDNTTIRYWNLRVAW